ncbi:MAG: DNA replication/repair protein RecF [Erysipelotrichales bacterium]|nr:DNA replication/repair protein RecF [Erysipelotrichales bacterium]
MKILNLKLLNFRNYEKLELSFNPSKNIIIGKNGMGKTNIVEAIYVLAFTKSFRGSKEEVVIKNNTDLTRIEGTIEDKNKDNYKVIIKNNLKKVKINNTNIEKLAYYLSNINIVLFTSEDLKLIKDTPNTRRKLINIELSQLSNDYLKILTYYNKVLKQRNSYLKTMYLNGNASLDYLDILTDQLIELGLKVNDYRQNFINDLNVYISKNYLKIAGKEGLELKYNSNYTGKSKEDLKNIYKKEKDRDIVLGKTNIGIHRDDYDFSLNNFSLKDYGSEGEQKNAIISLKMGEIEIFKDKKGVVPILILDDLFSELDEEKINNILDFISDEIQTFVTTTELDKVANKLKENSKIFNVINGKVEEECYEK